MKIASAFSLIAFAFGAGPTESIQPAQEEHRVGGLTAAQVFTQSSVAQVARAACEGDVAAVRKLRAGGTQIDGRGKSGITPLHWAITCENIAGIEALLLAGADANARAQYGITPVYAAASYPNSAMLRTLLRHGGNPNTVDDNQNTAVWVAIGVGHFQGKWDNYHALLDAGYDINRNYGARGTVAIWLLYAFKPSLVIELLDRGYSHDLEGLAVTVFLTRIDPGNDEYPALQKIPEMLRARGVDVDGIRARVEARERDRPRMEPPRP